MVRVWQEKISTMPSTGSDTERRMCLASISGSLLLVAGRGAENIGAQVVAGDGAFGGGFDGEAALGGDWPAPGYPLRYKSWLYADGLSHPLLPTNDFHRANDCVHTVLIATLFQSVNSNASCC